MSDETPVEPITDDLEAFSAELFGRSAPDPEPASSEAEEDEVTEELDAQETEDEDTLATEDEDTEEEEAEEAEGESDDSPQPKPKKKNRFQERIDQLTRDREEEKRARLALEARLEELVNKQNTKPEPVKTDVSEDTGPKPTDVNEDGTEKYPLGEFDPLYIKDLMRHTLNEESRAREEEMRQRQEQEQRDAAQAELQAEWNNKLVTAKERYPDFQDKGQSLIDSFSDIDPAYGEYLTNTIMEMEYGPDVFYYLSSHLDEARDIVNKGAKKATIALGHLEAKFADAEAEKQKARPKVSKAPAPPATLKGTNAVMPEVPDDTDDLDAFSKKLFKKKK